MYTNLHEVNSVSLLINFLLLRKIKNIHGSQYNVTKLVDFLNKGNFDLQRNFFRKNNSFKVCVLENLKIYLQI